MKRRKKMSARGRADTASKKHPVGEGITRGTVAKQLGVSVSTVVRWEGTLLHPNVRADGVRLFNAAEVAALAKKRAQESGAPVDGNLDADALVALSSRQERG